MEGAVRPDGERPGDPTAELPAAELADRVVQVGKWRFVTLVSG